jgi:regulator of nonsense transcripts 2
VKPPEGQSKIRQKIRTPMQQYIRYLIFEELHKGNVEKIVKYLRRLDWDDQATSDYVIRCLTKAYTFRWHLIRSLADVVSALSSYQEKAMTRVIDGVFEDIRAGLEIHSPKLAQRRIAMAKYLGELYIYRLIESQSVFNTLYSIISYGVTWNHEIISIVDPPESLFRLKLACTLLDTCGAYFQSSSSKKKLDFFLIFLQNYYWFKKSHPVFAATAESGDLFPFLIEHMYKECFHNLRPKLKLFKSYEKSQEEVEKLQKQLYPNLGAEDENKDALGTIMENESDYTTEAVLESDDDDDDEDGEMKAPRSEAEIQEDDVDEISQNDDLVAQDENIKPEKTEDDLMFEEMFDKMATDSYQERIKELPKVTTRDIPVPMSSKTVKKTYEQLQVI